MAISTSYADIHDIDRDSGTNRRLFLGLGPASRLAKRPRFHVVALERRFHRAVQTGEKRSMISRIARIRAGDWLSLRTDSGEPLIVTQPDLTPKSTQCRGVRLVRLKLAATGELLMFVGNFGAEHPTQLSSDEVKETAVREGFEDVAELTAWIAREFMLSPGMSTLGTWVEW